MKNMEQPLNVILPLYMAKGGKMIKNINGSTKIGELNNKIQKSNLKSSNKLNNSKNENVEISANSKFKDATSLLNSYNKLQSEFTKKCQELSKLKNMSERIVEEKIEKSLSDVLNNSTLSSENEVLDSQNQDNLVKNDLKSIDNNDNICQKNLIQNDENLEEIKFSNADDFVDSQNTNSVEMQNNKNNMQNVENSVDKMLKSTENAEIFRRKNWKEKVLDFFEKEPDAKIFSKDIALVLKKDKGLSSLDNALELAFACVKAKNFKQPASLLDDENFVKNEILNNSKIRDEIISSYLEDSFGRKISAPPVSNVSGSVPISPKRKISSLDEARKFLLKSFEK